MRKHMAKYLLPGAFFNESVSKEIPERTVEAAVAAAPKHAFAFEFYDVEEPDFDFDTTRFEVRPKALDRSPTHYIGGKVFNLIEIEHMENVGVLASNMRANHWDEVVQCRTGNWQPFKDGDVLVEVGSGQERDPA